MIHSLRGRGCVREMKNVVFTFCGLSPPFLVRWLIVYFKYIRYQETLRGPNGAVIDRYVVPQRGTVDILLTSKHLFLSPISHLFVVSVFNLHTRSICGAMMWWVDCAVVFCSCSHTSGARALGRARATTVPGSDGARI